MSGFVAKKVTDNVYWVGAIDWELRNFHGYSTSRGSTYNAFLILGEKPILIDTLKAPFYEQMMARIKSVIDPEKIAYIISNHSEMDHTGALPKTIATIKPDRVFASKMGVEAIKNHFHLDYPIQEVSNNQQLQLGDAKFTFLETRMLHWPDSMFTFYENEGILFSQDGFGMHFATEKLFVDENDQSIIRYEAAKYYANILLPYSSFVSRLLAALPNFNLKIKVIAPDHGPLWRKPVDIELIINYWIQWAKQLMYKKAVILYDTMWNSTAKMAASIADGISEQNVAVSVLPMQATNRSEIAMELLEAGAFIVGSPTINQQMFPSLADALCYTKGLKPKNLIGQAFGSYGWAGEATKIIQQELIEIGVELVETPVTVKYVPDDFALERCRAFGTNIAKTLNEKIATKNQGENND